MGEVVKSYYEVMAEHYVAEVGATPGEEEAIKKFAAWLLEAGLKRAGKEVGERELLKEVGERELL